MPQDLESWGLAPSPQPHPNLSGALVAPAIAIGSDAMETHSAVALGLWCPSLGKTVQYTGLDQSPYFSFRTEKNQEAGSSTAGAGKSLIRDCGPLLASLTC